MIPFVRILNYGNDISNIVLNGTYTEIASTATGYFNYGSVSIGDRIYVMGGVTTAAALTASGYYFDVKNPTVRVSIANLPRVLFSFGCTVWNNKIYAYGGTSRTGSTNIENANLYVYDISTNQWSTPTMITPPTGGYCSMVTIGDDIYIHGLSPDYTKMYKLNPVTNTFTALASSTTALQSQIASICTDGVRYIYSTSNNVIERYDITTNTWVVLQSNLDISGCSVYYHDYVYIQDRGKFGRYNVKTDEFDLIVSTNQYYRNSMEIANDKVYSIMGYTGSVVTNKIYQIT